jgi:hypothetical protein
VPRLLGGHVPQHLADGGLVLAGELARVGVAHLRGPLLQRGVDEHPVRVGVPRRLEARAQVLELHALEHRVVEDAAVARVVVQHRAVPVLLGGPQVGPLRPERVAAEVGGEQPVEVRQPLLGEEVEREGDAHGQRDARGAPAQLGEVVVGVGVGRGGEELAREPERPLGLVRVHQRVHHGLEVGEHLDLGERLQLWRLHAGNVRAGPPRWKAARRAARSSHDAHRMHNSATTARDPAPADPPRPPRADRLVRAAALVTVLVLAAAALKLARPVLVPLVGGVFLAVLARPGRPARGRGHAPPARLARGHGGHARRARRRGRVRRGASR